MEVNNGRFLSILDFGRFEYFRSLGWKSDLDSTKYGGAVAGSSVRYRKRLHLFQSFTVATRLVGLDERWWYFGQTIERQGNIHVSALIRHCATDDNGIVEVSRLEEAFGLKLERKVPDWVQAWADSDDMRPWVSMAEFDDDT